MPDVPCCEIRMIRTASSGLRPYLLVEGVPVILANLWAEDLLHKSRLNTVENYLRDIAIAYEWALSRGSPLEAKLERLAVFSPVELTSLAERLCSTKLGAGGYTVPTTSPFATQSITMGLKFKSSPPAPEGLYFCFCTSPWMRKTVGH